MRPTARLALFVLLAAPGCRPGAGGSSNEPIIGGTDDAGDPQVVALFGHVPGAQVGALCSAALITPSVLLTAAHCVIPAEVGEGAIFEAMVNSDGTQATGADWIPVARVEWDPAFDLSHLERGHDVAIAVLAAPLAIAPLPWNRAPLDGSWVGAAARVVGYGVTDGTAKVGAWHRRSADVAVRSVDAPLIHLGDSAAQTCFGDSGGPALATVAGALTIVGVTSFGDADCTNGGWDDRIDLEAQFLDGAIPAEDCPVCGGATPVCDHAAKACVGCVADGDCGAGSPRCNPLTHSCGVCATDADCPTGTPACSGTGQCVQCGEGNSALCTRDFPICDLKVGACVQCLADADCPAPTCDHPAAMACDGATHTCK